MRHADFADLHARARNGDVTKLCASTRARSAAVYVCDSHRVACAAHLVADPKALALAVRLMVKMSYLLCSGDRMLKVARERSR